MPVEVWRWEASATEDAIEIGSSRMGRPGVFTGSVVADVVKWGLGGQLGGAILGYWAAELKNRWDPGAQQDALKVAGRSALRAATFFAAVAAIGHLQVAIFY